MPEMDSHTRKQIIQFLNEAIDKALNSYKEFTDNPTDSNKSKEFKAHHDASKMALTHIQVLTKLMQLPELRGDIDGVSEEKMAQLITLAQSDVMDFEKEGS